MNFILKCVLLCSTLLLSMCQGIGNNSNEDNSNSYYEKRVITYTDYEKSIIRYEYNGTKRTDTCAVWANRNLATVYVSHEEGRFSIDVNYLFFEVLQKTKIKENVLLNMPNMLPPKRNELTEQQRKHTHPLHHFKAFLKVEGVKYNMYTDSHYIEDQIAVLSCYTQKNYEENFYFKIDKIDIEKHIITLSFYIVMCPTESEKQEPLYVKGYIENAKINYFVP